MSAPILDTYFKKVFLGAFGLMKGMTVTLGYFFRPSRIVTEQYPENRKTLKMHSAFRGAVTMPHDENGEHKCTGCTLCEKACPNATISVLNTKNIASKKVLGKYIYRIDQCTLCGLCIEACPFDAIKMSNEFEHAAWDRNGYDWVLNKKEGRG